MGRPLEGDAPHHVPQLLECRERIVTGGVFFHRGELPGCEGQIQLGRLTWAGAAKALLYNQLAVYDQDELTGAWSRIEDDVAEKMCLDAMSGRLWGKRIGDPSFAFDTYRGSAELRDRIKDRPSRTNSGIGIGWFIYMARRNGWRASRGDMFVPRIAIREAG